jgi:putative flavoprotein involved in K+ transport
VHRTATVVIGGGHAGLAISRALTESDHDHVVLERGRVAERWRSERWDSLRLLTPNWMSRLPSWQYDGDDPDGFMSTAELVEHLQRYAHSFSAPVLEGTAVRAVTTVGDRFRVATDSGTWLSDSVVVATGHCHRPAVPAAARGLDPSVTQLSPLEYRNPRSLRDGGVLVVGASSSGTQIAAELRSAGRDVVLAVGGHIRLPRRYRGCDIMTWLERMGALDRTVDELPATVARREPSLQLVGGSAARGLDLALLQQAGVELTGRLAGAGGQVVGFADDLPATVADADRRLRRVLARIDALGGSDDPGTDLPPVDVLPGATRIDLLARGISTVVWASGFRGSWPWLRLPVVAPAGHIVQHRGRTVVPGLYTVGQRFQHRRRSSFLDGVRHDVADILPHLVAAAKPPVARAV